MGVDDGEDEGDADADAPFVASDVPPGPGSTEHPVAATTAPAAITAPTVLRLPVHMAAASP
ncbi:MULTISPECIES: hypothetical protein [Streptomyces]